jgi:DNA-binding Lrp family transcriptional regulator
MVSESVTEFREIHSDYAKQGSGLVTGSMQNESVLMQADPKAGMSSREDILAELEALGVDVEPFDSLPNMILADILVSLKDIVSLHSARRGRPTKRATEAPDGPPVLSNTDKKILKALLTSNGSISSLTLSKSLDIPLSTVQRRRKRLEANLLETSYSIRIEKFGLRSASLYITTARASAELIGREVLSWDKEVLSVKRCIGENSIDLQAEVLFESNKELLAIIERIKSLEGVSGVSWSEAIKTIGKNAESYQRVIQ